MAKAEWGLKRTCLSCGARFYDLQREPIICPACGATVDAVGPSKPRRSRAAAAPVRVAAAPAAEVEVAVVDDEVADDEVETDEDEEVVEKEVADDEAEEDGESAIEDVSELGDDDMADVIDTEIDEEGTDR